MESPGINDLPDRRGWLYVSDAELVAIVVAPGVRRRDPTAVARDLLAHAGDLRALLLEPLPAIRATPGIGAAGAARLAAALEIGRRHLSGRVRARQQLGSPADAAAFLRARLADLDHEVFACLFLDTRHRVICFEPLFRGTLDGAAVYPREVLKRALHHNAGAVILAHNHPSGDSEPSAADRTITERLEKALALVDVRLLDHFVVSTAGHVSLAERGWL